MNKSSQLIQLLENKTTTYKLFFFLALLNLIKKDNQKLTFDIDEVIKEMLISAWYPAVFFKLNFGKQDQIYKILKQIPLIDGVTPNRNMHQRLSQLIDIHYSNKTVGAEKLKLYVPKRFIRPFFELETKGMKDQHVNQAIVKLSNDAFDSIRPLYKLSANSDTLEFHRTWHDYLIKNYGIIHQWVYGEIGKHLQNLNPNTPNIINKLTATHKRASLSRIRKEWKEVIIRDKLYCPYSTQRLDCKNFELDHYLPWSFLVHDKCWNLTPSSKEANLHKSNQLPSEDYFEIFVSNQTKYLKHIHNFTNIKTCLEDFQTDLDIVYNLSNQEILKRYTQIYEPMISIARNQGFKANWTYED